MTNTLGILRKKLPTHCRPHTYCTSWVGRISPKVEELDMAYILRSITGTGVPNKYYIIGLIFKIEYLLPAGALQTSMRIYVLNNYTF